MNNKQFCSNLSPIFEQVVNLISSNIIHLTGEKIEEKYNIWNENFETGNSQDFLVEKSKLSQTFNLPSDACCLGVDFPSWLNFNGGKKKIMLFGIDPLRNEDAFKTLGNNIDNNTPQYNIHDDVSIGTPFAFHHKKMREGRTKEYWKFIDLLSDSYSVYITDIYKVFYYRNEYKGRRSYLDLSDERKVAHENILKSEIELVKPDIIIAMGDKTVKLLSKQDKLVPSLIHTNIGNSKYFFGDIRIIPMVHLSGASYETHKQTFIKANNQTGRNYGELYFEIIKDHFDVDFIPEKSTEVIIEDLKQARKFTRNTETF